MVSSTPRPHFIPGKDPVPILQEAGWAPGPAWTGGKSRPHRDSTPDRPARSQSLYRLSYRAHELMYICTVIAGKTVLFVAHTQEFLCTRFQERTVYESLYHDIIHLNRIQHPPPPPYHKKKLSGSTTKSKISFTRQLGLFPLPFPRRKNYLQITQQQ